MRLRLRRTRFDDFDPSTTLGYEHTDPDFDASWSMIAPARRLVRSHRRVSQYRRPVAALTVALSLSAALTATMMNIGPHRSSEIAGTFVSGNDGLGDLERITGEIEADLQRRSRERADRQTRESTPSREPVRGAESVDLAVRPPTWVNPVPGARVSSCYGPRGGRLHAGVDLSAPTGTLIRAVGAGRVVQTGWGLRGLGYSVVIKHAGGQMTLYGHMSKVLTRVGQTVKTGAVIGRVGSTGHSTGPHLHLGWGRASSLGDLFNNLVNPAIELKKRGVLLPRCI